MEKTLLRPDEVAQLLRVSRWTVYRWLAEGKIAGTKLGKGTIRVFKRSVDELVEQNESSVLLHPRSTNGSRTSVGQRSLNKKP